MLALVFVHRLIPVRSAGASRTGGEAIAGILTSIADAVAVPVAGW
jgi:hypothetical protein